MAIFLLIHGKMTVLLVTTRYYHYHDASPLGTITPCAGGMSTLNAVWPTPSCYGMYASNNAHFEAHTYADDGADHPRASHLHDTTYDEPITPCAGGMSILDVSWYTFSVAGLCASNCGHYEERIYGDDGAMPGSSPDHFDDSITEGWAMVQAGGMAQVISYWPSSRVSGVFISDSGHRPSVDVSSETGVSAVT